MKPKHIVIALVLVAGGFLAGWMSRGPGDGGGEAVPADTVADARAALEELVKYRGEGARGARTAMDLVYRIAEGGEALAAEAAGAVRTAPAWKYGVPAYSYDNRAGKVAQFPTRKVALMEAAARLGGPKVIAALKAASRDDGPREDRLAALLFLSWWEERPDIRAFYGERLGEYLDARNDGSELTNALDVMRGRLEPGMFAKLASAFSAGWVNQTSRLMAETLVAIDHAKAGRLFMTLVEKPANPKQARKSAAWALGRMPALRRDAAALLLTQGQIDVLTELLKGMRHGRYGEVDMERAARESQDPEVALRYTEERIKNLEGAVELVGEVRPKLGVMQSEQIGLSSLEQQFKEAIAYGYATLTRLKEERDAGKPADGGGDGDGDGDLDGNGNK